MTGVKSRREEYAETTYRALLEAAATLFCERGYTATSIDDVARQARVTSGAVYHHFAGKRDLFRVVFEDVQRDVLLRVRAVAEADAEESSWAWAMAALRAYLRCCWEPRYRAVVLQEGPAALGWAAWRELDHAQSLPLLEAVLGRLIAVGVMPPQPVGLLARMLCAAIGEAAIALATSDDPEQYAVAAERLLEDLCRGLTVQAPEGPAVRR